MERREDRRRPLRRRRRVRDIDPARVRQRRERHRSLRLRPTRRHPRHHPHPRIKRRLHRPQRTRLRGRRLPVHHHDLDALGQRSGDRHHALPDRGHRPSPRPGPGRRRQRHRHPRRPRQPHRSGPGQLVLPSSLGRRPDHGPGPTTRRRQHPHRPRVPDQVARHLQRQARHRRRERHDAVRIDRRHRLLGTPRTESRHRRRHPRRPPPPLPGMGLPHPDRHTYPALLLYPWVRFGLGGRVGGCQARAGRGR